MRKSNRLFIIGNGFDLAHGLETRYDDFRLFLQKFDPEYSRQYVLKEYGDPFGGSPAHMIVCLISSASGNQWRDVEAACGELIFDNCFELWNKQTMTNDVAFGQVISRDLSYDIFYRMKRLPDYLDTWISKVDTSVAKVIPRFKQLMDPIEDHFLTFNYTDTLESLYGARNVLHIHGQSGGPLIFGHGNCERDMYSECEVVARGSGEGLAYLHDYLRKNVPKVIEQNADWFEKITRLNEVYSFGFSYAPVDLPYIGKICRSMRRDEETIWYLHNFDGPEKRQKFQQSIRDCGFTGSFDVFHV